MKSRTEPARRNARRIGDPGEALARENLAQLRQAARRLEEKGLAGFRSESLSLRIPGSGQFLLLRAAGTTPLARAGAPELLPVSIQTAVGALPESPVEQIHATIYKNRPDTGAIFIGQPAWSAALIEIEPMPAIFDEQARQLGQKFQTLTVTGGRPGADTLRALKNGASVYFADGSVVILGMILDKVVFNAELLEKCARAYILACLTGGPVRKIPFYVRLIANQRLKKDQARSAASYARGEVPGGFTAY